MDVEVASRLGNALARRISDSSLVGDSMLVRLRSGAIGLVGLAAAVGLGLIALLSQQGLPDVSSGPLPPRPPAPFVHRQTIAMPAPSRPQAQPPRHAAIASAPAPSTAVSPPPAAPEITEPRHVQAPAGQQGTTTTPATSPPPHPAPAPQPQPTPSQSAPPPTTAATTTPESTPAATDPPAVASHVEEDSPGHSGDRHGHVPAGSRGGHGSSTGDGHSSGSALPSYGSPNAAAPADDHGGDSGHGSDYGNGHGGSHGHDR
jgi:outer membrane biosynthesis protein TonB